jgi:hypothetical protein
VETRCVGEHAGRHQTLRTEGSGQAAAMPTPATAKSPRARFRMERCTERASLRKSYRLLRLRFMRRSNTSVFAVRTATIEPMTAIQSSLSVRPKGRLRPPPPTVRRS